MLKYILSFIIFALIGIISTGIGGIISYLINIKNKKVLAVMYEITAGIMTGIVCFDMIDQGYMLNGIVTSIVGVLIGAIFVFIMSEIIEKKDIKNSNGIAVTTAMALHNMPEGLAIGASFCISNSLGINMLIAIALHNIPEGIVVGILNKKEKSIISSIFVGAFLGVGGLIGRVVGELSNFGVSFVLSVAAGAMLYIVACDLIPNSKKITDKRIISFMYIVGIIIGLILSKI